MPSGMSISLRDLTEASSSTARDEETMATKGPRRRLNYSSESESEEEKSVSESEEEKNVSESEEEESGEDEAPDKRRRVQEEENEEETLGMQHLGDENNSEDRVFEESNYVLVQFVGDGKKEQPHHFVGKVVKKLEDGSRLRVTYLRRAEVPVGKENQNVLAFKNPNKTDDFDTAVSDIVTKLTLKSVTKSL